MKTNFFYTSIISRIIEYFKKLGFYGSFLNASRKVFLNKKVAAFSLLVASFIFACNGQAIEKDENNNKNKPQTNITVNKEYDEDGNIIRYDSTYSYYYSSIEDDTLIKDSMMDSFKNYFNEQFFFSAKPFFNDMFFEDSLLFYDFYKDDFFIKRYLNNINHMEYIFREMDSLKNEFFNQQFERRE